MAQSSNTPPDTPWYADSDGLFGPGYLDEYQGMLTPDRTAADANFIEQELKLGRGAKVLDLACGHGRHAIELARRGYDVTGQDLNAFFLDKARQDAKQAGVAVRWVQSDMREIPFESEFDAVINMFTAFGYLESDEEDQKVVQQVSRSLKPGGRFLLDVINRERIMRVFNPQEGKVLPDGSLAVTERRFDFATSRNHERRVRIWPNGRKKEVTLSLRMHSLHELISMCHTAGLEHVASFGGNDSSPIGFDSQRCMVIARK